MLSDSSTGSVAVVSRYDAPTPRQSALADLLEKHLQDWICRRPGFIAGWVLRSVDEHYVIVYTTWQQMNDGVSFMSCDEGKSLFAALVNSGAKERESFTYFAGTIIRPPSTTK